MKQNTKRICFINVTKRVILICIFFILFQTQLVNASLAINVPVPELIEKADSIVIGKISVSEFTGSGFRVVVQINEYLGESPNRNYVIVGDSEGMRFRPYVGDAVLLLLSKQGDTFNVLNYGSGMFSINDESSKYPEISELLRQEFTPFKGSGLSFTGYCIISGLCLIALFPLIYMKNRKYI